MMSLFLVCPFSANFAHISIFDMPINNRILLEKWLVKIINTTTVVWNLQLRNQWIPTHSMYKYYCTCTKHGIPLHAFTSAYVWGTCLSTIDKN
jgi:hypothetical protein